MWFVLLAIALALVTVGGLYFRRRFLLSLATVGVSPSWRRFAGAAIPWLLFGFPVLVFASVLVTLALGRESFTMELPRVGEWLLVYPFFLAVLIVLQSVPYLLVLDGLAWLLARRIGPPGRVGRWRSIACLVVVGAFAIYTPLRIVLERDALRVHHYVVGDGDSEPLRIAFLADLQQDRNTDEDRGAQVVRLINQEKPDLILSGGDWINTGPDFIETAARTAGSLESRLGTTSVRGDHEHFAFRDQQRSALAVTRALAAEGVEMLDNEVRTIEHAGRRIAIIYLGYNYIFRAGDATIRRLLESAEDADYRILLTHQFDNHLAELVKDRVELALIAHTHGGQVNPMVGFVHFPIARVETPYVEGRYQLGNTTLIVTAGIGYSIAPFRYASPPSIEIIDLEL